MEGVWKTTAQFPVVDTTIDFLHVTFKKSVSGGKVSYTQDTPSWDTPGFSNGKGELIGRYFDYFDKSYYGNLSLNTFLQSHIYKI